tara:strand:+ start:372 stop:656 length:285 start_codon:yes stop_codon:yes gene_type:complete
MFSFLKSLKLPFNQKIVQCLSIIVIVLLVLYFSGFINTDKIQLPFEAYEETEDQYPESESSTEDQYPTESQPESQPEAGTKITNAIGALIKGFF